MKRLLSLLLLLCLVFCGCGKREDFLQNTADGEVLYSIDGDAVVYAEDLKDFYKNALFEAEYKKLEKPDLEECFKRLCQMRTLSYLAGRYGFAQDKAPIETEFKTYMKEIEDSSVYGDALSYAKALQAALGMEDDEFMEYNVGVSLMYKNADALIEGFAENYTHISDGRLIAEEIDKNLAEYINSSEIYCGYPELGAYMPEFTYIYGAEE